MTNAEKMEIELMGAHTIAWKNMIAKRNRNARIKEEIKNCAIASGIVIAGSIDWGDAVCKALGL